MRSVERRRIPPDRRVVTEALRIGRRQVPIQGLFDVDITDVRQHLSDHNPPLSTTAFVAACVGRAAAAHPEVHAYRDWRGRLVIHRHVDIATMLEVRTPDGVLPLAHLIVDADSRSVTDISDEIRTVVRNPDATPDRKRFSRGLPAVVAVPGLVRLGYWLANRSVRIRRRTGTVAVTAVGMFGGGGGFGIAAPTLMTLGVVVGGISHQPRVVDDRIEIREVMDVTVAVDHRIIDGAPTARFAADLRRLLHSGELLEGC